MIMAIKMIIDEKAIEAEADMTILEAAGKNGIHIPTLCYIKELDPHASCRMCVVEVEGARTFQPACATKVREGMVVRTDTEELRRNRKLTIQMIMAHHPVDCHHCLRIGSSKEEDLDPKFCEMCFFCDCVKDGICELQQLNREYHVDALPFDIEGYRYSVDDSLHSVVRDPNKCIKCRRCVDVCNDVQTVHNLALFRRGQEYRVTASMDKPMDESLCVRCGRCVDVCPTGAIFMEENIDKMLFATHSYETKTIGMASETLLSEMEKLNKMEPGTLDVHRIIAGLHKIGVDCVVSEEQAVNESKKEAEELIMHSDEQVIISNSYAVKNFVDMYFPDIADHICYYKSVQESFASIAERIAEQSEYDKNALKTIVFTDNNENGSEAREKGTVDFSMNAWEIYRTFKRTGVDLSRIKPVDALKFDTDPEFVFGKATGPVVFNYKTEPELLKIDGKNIAIAHNLGQTRKLLEEVRSGSSRFDVIRLSA